MEEKKVKEATEPTYEELKKELIELKQKLIGTNAMNTQLYQQLVSANMENLYKRLDYLFKVLSVHAKDNSLFTAEFIQECEKEIIDLMSPAKEVEVKE